jgi:hypothetical protein
MSPIKYPTQGMPIKEEKRHWLINEKYSAMMVNKKEKHQR